MKIVTFRVDQTQFEQLCGSLDEIAKMPWKWLVVWEGNPDVLWYMYHADGLEAETREELGKKFGVEACEKLGMEARDVKEFASIVNYIRRHWHSEDAGWMMDFIMEKSMAKDFAALLADRDVDFFFCSPWEGYLGEKKILGVY